MTFIPTTPLDRYDLALLAKCSDKVYEFMKTDAQEHRAFDLVEQGMLERQFEEYKASAGRKQIDMRWAYRRTPAGAATVRQASPGQRPAP